MFTNWNRLQTLVYVSVELQHLGVRRLLSRIVRLVVPLATRFVTGRTGVVLKGGCEKTGTLARLNNPMQVKWWSVFRIGRPAAFWAVS